MRRAVKGITTGVAVFFSCMVALIALSPLLMGVAQIVRLVLVAVGAP